MHYLDKLHRPSFGATRRVRIQSAKRSKLGQNSTGVDKFAPDDGLVQSIEGRPPVPPLRTTDALVAELGCYLPSPSLASFTERLPLIID